MQDFPAAAPGLDSGAMVLNFRHSQPPRLSQFPVPDPDEVTQLLRRAATCAADGRAIEALRCFQTALLIDEERADVWFHYGTLQRKLGQLDDALESFEFALRIDPVMYAARYNVARIYYDMGRPLEAIQHFETVLQQRPSYVPAWRHLVRITWALGDLVEAARLACDGLQRADGDEELEVMLQQILVERGEASTQL
jgi:tetratricopeptide (TPR) repeat protein